MSPAGVPGRAMICHSPGWPGCGGRGHGRPGRRRAGGLVPEAQGAERTAFTARGRLVFRGTQSGKCCPHMGFSAKRKGNGPRWAALEPGGPGPAGGGAGGPGRLGFRGNHKPLRGEGGPGLRGSDPNETVHCEPEVTGAGGPGFTWQPIPTRLGHCDPVQLPASTPGSGWSWAWGERPSLGRRGAGVPEAPLPSPEASHVPAALGGRSGGLPSGCRGGDSGVGGKGPPQWLLGCGLGATPSIGAPAAPRASPARSATSVWVAPAWDAAWGRLTPFPSSDRSVSVAWRTCGLPGLHSPGHRLAWPGCPAWAGRAAAHPPAASGASVQAPRKRLGRCRGPERAGAEAVAGDPWRPGRLWERNMEAITVRAVAEQFPPRRGGRRAQPGARRPNEAIKARVLRL